jgi:hypothetical protein
MSVLWRNRIPLALLTFLGLIALADYFLNLPTAIANAVDTLKTIATVTSSFALGLGLISVTRLNISRWQRDTEDKYYGAWTMIVLVVFLVVGGIFGTNSTQYQWLFTNIYSQINMTLYSLLGFYIVYASYKAFVARTWDVGVMIIVALFTMLGRAPIGEYFWLGFGEIYEYIYQDLAVGGIAGFYITVAIGTVIIAIRVLMGRERASLG